MININEVELPAFPWQFHAQGDANEYCLITSNNHWVIAFRLNGELMTLKQEAIIRHMVAAANAAEGVGITELETVGKELFDGNTATLVKQRNDLLDVLRSVKSNLMHTRRFGHGTLQEWRKAAVAAEGDIEEAINSATGGAS